MNSATGPTSVPTIIRQADQDITSVREALGITTPAPGSGRSYQRRREHIRPGHRAKADPV
jgi:hypothetical protein